MKLYPHQEKAVERLKNGSVLVGGVGSGKSLTALYYWHTKVCGGQFNPYRARKNKKKLYIITTARKRDTGDWDEEITPFLPKKGEYVVDSWNNIGKYIRVTDAFFIFDEQKVVSMGSWAKTFVKITRSNQWILLSATPADTWSDMIPLFIAHRFVKSKTDFYNKYCVFARFSKYPKIERYVSEQELSRFRSKIFVVMKDQRKQVQHHKNVFFDYDRVLYNFVVKERKNPYNIDPETQKPMPCMDMGEVCRVLRKIVGTSEDKLIELRKLYDRYNRLVIFYNQNFELEILRNWCLEQNILWAEWNGHKHEEVPTTDHWCYLCQYTSAAEAWNCVTTNCTVLFSPSYSYKQMKQSYGRIDRMNSPYSDLYYYHMLSNSSIDKAIIDALKRKKNFQERDLESYL